MLKYLVEDCISPSLEDTAWLEDTGLISLLFYVWEKIADKCMEN